MTSSHSEMSGGKIARYWRLGRHFLGCDINAEYVALANKRIKYGGNDKQMMKDEKGKDENAPL